MNRYIGALGITLFFYLACVGAFFLSNIFFSSKKEAFPLSETIAIVIQKEQIPTPPMQVSSPSPSTSQTLPSLTPIVKEKPVAKVQKNKSIDPLQDKVALPLIAQIEKEESSLSSLPEKQAVVVPKQMKGDTLHVKQEHYFQHLKERINQHKFYPKMAQKKSIEGSVIVEFTISAKGELLSYAIMDGKTIFSKSVEEAILKSFPFPIEEELFTQTQTIQLEIVYTLL